MSEPIELHFFEGIPDYIIEQLPQYCDIDTLKAMVFALKNEITDLNLQLEKNDISNRIENKQDNIDTLEWKERVLARKRVKSTMYEIVTYNISRHNKQTNKKLLNKIKNLEDSNTALKAKLVKITKRQENINNYLLRVVYALMKSQANGETCKDLEYLIKDLEFIPDILEDNPDWGIQRK